MVKTVLYLHYIFLTQWRVDFDRLKRNTNDGTIVFLTSMVAEHCHSKFMKNFMDQFFFFFHSYFFFVKYMYFSTNVSTKIKFILKGKIAILLFNCLLQNFNGRYNELTGHYMHNILSPTKSQ